MSEELCDICEVPFKSGDVRMGHGDGSGQRFAHRGCYWREKYEEADKYGNEGWAWLDDALKALGGETVFEIPSADLVPRAFAYNVGKGARAALSVERVRGEALADAAEPFVDERHDPRPGSSLCAWCGNHWPCDTEDLRAALFAFRGQETP